MKIDRRSWVISAAVAAVVAWPLLSTAATRRVFAFEYTTQSEQWLVFWDKANIDQTVTVDIYRPNGSYWGSKTVDLRPRETVTITDQAKQWKLPVGPGDGTPSSDYAYGMVAHSDHDFGMFASNDEQELGGSGYSTIFPLDAHTDAWWGMYNYPGNDTTKHDYFFLTNPNGTAGSAEVKAYRSNGSLLTTTTISLAAHQTVKVYPRADLGVPSGEQNIGVHLVSEGGAGISVYTQLGSQWEFGKTPGYYTTHDNTTGLFVPWTTECLSTRYVWEEQMEAQQLSAARVTNPNGFPVTVIHRVHVYDGNGAIQGYYENTTIIPGHGTAEIEMPHDENLKNEADNAPWHHWRELEADAAIHAHVSYEANIALPSVPDTTWTWGAQDPSRTRTVFIINPNDKDIRVESQAIDYQSGSANTQSGRSLVIPARDAKLVSYTSSEGPVFDSVNDVTYRFFSNDPFALHLQEPTYGDVLPQECGGNGLLGALGDYVWYDVDVDGIQDGGETGIQGVVVQLLVGNVLLEETTTDSAGFYQFINLLPATYTVKVADANFAAGGTLEGWSVSPPDQGGDDALDSDGDVVTHDETVVLGLGETNYTIDFGYHLPASIGDYVWLDIDKDGIQDAVEGGINGITVELHDDSGSGVPVATTATAVNGAYLFSGLVPGNYYVKFCLKDATYSFSPQDTGSEGVDSDADTTTGETVLTALSPGENDMTWDAGMYVPSTLVTLSSFGAAVENGQVVVSWETSSEFNSAGFFLERLDEESGGYVRINAEMVSATLFSRSSETYSTVDTGAETTGSLTYRLVEIETSGDQNTYGPYEVTLGGGEVIDGGSSDEAQPDEPAVSATGVDVVSLASGNGHVVLRWSSEAGKTYRIEQAVGDSSTEFKVLAAGVPATPPENTAVLVDGADSGLYRIASE